VIRTKIEERTVGKEVRFYPMVEKKKKGLFSRKNKWVEFTELGGNVFDDWEEVVYFDKLRDAKAFLGNYLINEGQCERITHWYPEYAEEVV